MSGSRTHHDRPRSGQFPQAVLYILIVRPRHQLVGVEPRRNQRFMDYFRIVHLLWVFPHVMERSPDIRLKHALELGRNRATHEHDNGEKGIRLEGRNVVAADETLRFKRHELGLVFDALERICRLLPVSLKMPPSSTGT
jgi:hypothetical protein